MKVATWGNSLAVRIPRDVARKLDLAKGDEIEIRVASDGVLEVSRDDRRALALERIRKLARLFPADYKFDREEANER